MPVCLTCVLCWWLGCEQCWTYCALSSLQVTGTGGVQPLGRMCSLPRDSGINTTSVWLLFEDVIFSSG